jgi:hypothetical protein
MSVRKFGGHLFGQSLDTGTAGDKTIFGLTLGANRRSGREITTMVALQASGLSMVDQPG